TPKTKHRFFPPLAGIDSLAFRLLKVYTLLRTNAPSNSAFSPRRGIGENRNCGLRSGITVAVKPRWGPRKRLPSAWPRCVPLFWVVLCPSRLGKIQPSLLGADPRPLQTRPH